MDMSVANRNTYDITVILNNSAFVTVTGNTQICEGDSVNLTASGGFSYLWSNGETTPSIEATEDGTYSVVITNQAGDCDIIPPSVEVTVNEIPNVVLTNTNQVDQCAYDDFLQLTGGLPSGGDYSGVAVVNGIFNPSQAGAGDHTLYYTYTDPAQCHTVADSAVYTVHPDVGAINSFPLASLCLGSDPILFDGYGTPAGGTWFIDNASATEFNPQFLGLGTFETSYIAENVACVDTAFMTVEVISAVTATLDFPSDTICMDYGMVDLTGGEPSGGDYFGTGVANGMIDPISLGGGTHNIGYGYDAGAGCADTAYADIEVVDSADAQLILPFSFLCDYNPAVVLSGGTPAGGNYFGTSVSNGEFDPSIGEGTYTIGYAYSDVNMCADTAYTTIDVELCSGIDEINSNAMQIYPNPSIDEFAVTFTDQNTVGELEIRNVLGQVVFTQPINREPSIRINSEWPAGNYLLILKTAEFIGVERLTVVK